MVHCEIPATLVFSGDGSQLSCVNSIEDSLMEAAATWVGPIEGPNFNKNNLQNIKKQLFMTVFPVTTRLSYSCGG